MFTSKMIETHLKYVLLFSVTNETPAYVTAKKKQVEAHPRNIHTKCKANRCSGLREEVKNVFNKKLVPTKTTTMHTG